MHKDETYTPFAKDWGLQRPILRNPPLHVDEIEVFPGGFCSVHRHNAKSNLFHVLKGELLILRFDGAGQLLMSQPLKAGDYNVVRAGFWHQFWSQPGCVAQEVYFGLNHEPILASDIERMKGLERGGISLMLSALPSVEGSQ